MYNTILGKITILGSQFIAPKDDIKTIHDEDCKDFLADIIIIILVCIEKGIS